MGKKENLFHPQQNEPHYNNNNNNKIIVIIVIHSLNGEEEAAALIISVVSRDDKIKQAAVSLLPSITPSQFKVYETSQYVTGIFGVALCGIEELRITM